MKSPLNSSRIQKPLSALTKRQTLDSLRYIANSPLKKHGGFHPQTILIAKSALHHLTN